MKADYVLDQQELCHLLRGGTLRVTGYNFVKGARDQLLNYRQKFTPYSRKNKQRFRISGNWGKVSDYPEVAKVLPPCPFCEYPFPVTKHANAFRDGEISGDRVIREFTFVWCTECNFRLFGGLTGTQTVAFEKWRKAWNIVNRAKSEIAPNDMFFLPNNQDLPITASFKYIEPGPRYLMGKGNRVNEEQRICVFGEADFHDFLRDDVVFVSPYDYYRFGFNTLLNHRIEFNVKRLADLIECEEEIERRNTPVI